MRILLEERKGRQSSSSSSPSVSNLSSTRFLIKPRSKRRTSHLLHKLILTSAAITMAAMLTQPQPCRLEDHPQLNDVHIITTEKGRERGLLHLIIWEVCEVALWLPWQHQHGHSVAWFHAEVYRPDPPRSVPIKRNSVTLSEQRGGCLW